MKKTVFGLAAALVVSLLAGLMVPAQVYASEDIFTDSADNVVGSGDYLTISPEVYGNEIFGSFTAARKIEYKNMTFKDAVAMAGMNISIDDSNVGGSLFAAGQQVDIRNTVVDGNIAAAGYKVTIDGKSSANAVYATGQSVAFEGTAKSFTASAQTVSLSGVIEGDANITAESISIADDAVIKGELKVYSVKEPVIGKASEVGTYIYEKAEEQLDAKSNVSPVAAFFAALAAKLGKALYWSVAMIIVGLILRALFGNVLSGAAVMLKEKQAGVFGYGALVWILVPIAAVIAAVTVIGLPLSVFAMMIYVFLLCIGVAFTGASLSELVFPKMNKYLATVIGIAILEFAKVIPFIGVLISIAADIFLLGFVAISLSNYRKAAKAQ